MSKGHEVVYDLDKEYHDKGRESERILRVTVEGNLLPEELTYLAEDRYILIGKV